MKLVHIKQNEPVLVKKLVRMLIFSSQLIKDLVDPCGEKQAHKWMRNDRARDFY